jgi:hypothetical protein
MAELKTKRNRKSVRKFIAGVENDRRRADAEAVLALMEEVMGEKPAMWGDKIVGFGSYRYKYESGREGDWFVVGLSPGKARLSLYIMTGFSRYQDLLKKLGKHKTGSCCLYINRLEDIDMKVLRRIIKDSAARVKRSDKSA